MTTLTTQTKNHQALQLRAWVSRASNRRERVRTSFELVGAAPLVVAVPLVVALCSSPTTQREGHLDWGHGFGSRSRGKLSSLNVR